LTFFKRFVNIVLNICAVRANSKLQSAKFIPKEILSTRKLRKSRDCFVNFIRLCQSVSCSDDKAFST